MINTCHTRDLSKRKLIRLLNSTGILHDKKGFLTSTIPDM